VTSGPAFKNYFRAAAFIIILLFSLSAVSAQTFSDSGDAESLAAALVEKMSDEEALAQTFMFGWPDASPSPLILEWIRQRKIGGVKVFGWNAQNLETLARTVGALQTAALSSPLGIPLLVATDQEGGLVRHVKGRTSDAPGNMAIGASGFPEDAYRAGLYIGRELALLGINMNFAPVLDLATARESALIGPRSFGSDPVRAGLLGAAFMKGQGDAGVISTAKHFPGHGGTSLDSHGILPRIAADEETLWNRELVPFRMLAKDGLPAIMSGHLAFPDTPAGNAPASLSRWFLTDVLRSKMKFRGLLITDDLLMYGVSTAGGSLANTAKEALMAGNDMLLVSSTPELYDHIWTVLAWSLRNEGAFRARVREAAQRIVACKLKHLRGENAAPLVPDAAKARSGIPAPGSAEFFLGLAARSATLVEGGGALPLLPESAGRVLLAGQYNNFFVYGRKAYPGAAGYFFVETGNAELFRSAARNADTVVFCLGDGEGVRLLNAIADLGKRIVVMSVLNPVFVEQVERRDIAIALYSFSDESFAAGFSALLGRFAPEGKAP
jgi:beta-N-acetylhexosaminidase